MGQAWFKWSSEISRSPILRDRYKAFIEYSNTWDIITKQVSSCSCMRTCWSLFIFVQLPLILALRRQSRKVFENMELVPVYSKYNCTFIFLHLNISDQISTYAANCGVWVVLKFAHVYFLWIQCSHQKYHLLFISRYGRPGNNWRSCKICFSISGVVSRIHGLYGGWKTEWRYGVLLSLMCV